MAKLTQTQTDEIIAEAQEAARVDNLLFTLQLKLEHHNPDAADSLENAYQSLKAIRSAAAVALCISYAIVFHRMGKKAQAISVLDKARRDNVYTV